VFLWDESQDDAGERFMTPEPMAKVELSLRRPKGLCRGIGGPGEPRASLIPYKLYSVLWGFRQLVRVSSDNFCSVKMLFTLTVRA
jgi:hypothetical protein